jgi:uncharacterized membrane protein YfcA
VLPERLADRMRIPVGFLTGAVNGLTGSQIMPSLPYLLARPLERSLFLQTINTSFTLSSFAMAAGLAWIEFLNAETALFSVLALLPMGAGLWVGGTLRDRLSNEAFRRTVLLLLIALGGLLLARSAGCQAAIGC